MPAMVADRYEAIVPQKSAFIPSFARSRLLSGANAPIPPICMPTLLKLAKPQIAMLIISNPFSVKTGTDLFVRF